MKCVDRKEPFPPAMQGRWAIVDDAGKELLIEGGEITCYGDRIEYDCKEISVIEGALTISLKVEDEAREDTFAKANITDLVITPEGEFLAYNVKFSIELQRPEP